VDRCLKVDKQCHHPSVAFPSISPMRDRSRASIQISCGHQMYPGAMHVAIRPSTRAPTYASEFGT
jgi:hypothetical protein